MKQFNSAEHVTMSGPFTGVSLERSESPAVELPEVVTATCLGTCHTQVQTPPPLLQVPEPC